MQTIIFPRGRDVARRKDMLNYPELTGAGAKEKLQSIGIKSPMDNKMNPEITSGGRALRFYASVRIDVRRGESIGKNPPIGHIVRCSLKKNKVATPFKKCEYAVLYGKGVDRLSEIADISVEEGIITRAGSWYSYQDETGNVLKDKAGEELRWHGTDAFKDYLRDNPHFYKELYDEVMAQI